MVPLSDLGL